MAFNGPRDLADDVFGHADVDRGRGLAAGDAAATRNLNLLAHAGERRVGGTGDLWADQVERHQDCLRLERRQAGRAAEVLAVQLLLDVDHALAVEFGVDGVAAATEVDEVEEVDLLDHLLVVDLVAILQDRGRDAAALIGATRLEKVGEQGLEHGEALRRDRVRRAGDRRLGLRDDLLGRGNRRRVARMRIADVLERLDDGVHDLARAKR